jgi:transcriptional regulator with XRE-family HTH domain
MDSAARKRVGRILKDQRVSRPLTLQELAARTGVSASHLGRIERGERFPSAHVLKRMAAPLGFDENELFTVAGYLSPQAADSPAPAAGGGRLDPYVARILSQETVAVQRAVVGILTILRSIAGNVSH